MTKNEPHADNQEKRHKPPWMRRRYAGLIFLFLMLGSLASILIFLISSNSGASPEILLPVFLIIGSIVLLIALMVVALTTNFIVGRNGSPSGALGMPDGSVSAVIALMLLLVFAIFTIHLFNQVRAGEGDGFVSRGITSATLQSLPQNRILEITVENPESAPEARTFQVRLAAAHPDSIDFAKNAATIVGTLLTAVAGFYFGEKATKLGVDSAKAKRPEEVAANEAAARATEAAAKANQAAETANRATGAANVAAAAVRPPNENTG